MTASTRHAELLEAIDIRSASRRGTVESILAVLEDVPRGDLLDAPCGPGLLSEALHRLGFRVTAADLDGGTFRASEAIPFLRLDLEGRLPFPDGAFDTVVCGDGVEHLENPFALLREISRVLRLGGRALIATPNYLNLERRLQFFLSGSLVKPLARRPGTLQRPRFDRGHINPLTLVRLAYMAENACLELERFTTANPKPRQRWLAPLALPVLVYRSALSERRRHDLFARESLSLRLLFGGQTLIALFRKRAPS